MTNVRFPSELIRPTTGDIVYFGKELPDPRAGTWSITIPIEPFSADGEDSRSWRPGTEGPFVISTAVRLDFIELPAEDLMGLANRAFRFPVNPVDGYIDGSVYLSASHNPVDVTAIEFGAATGASITATFAAAFCFQYELADVLNFDKTLTTSLRFSRQ